MKGEWYPVDDAALIEQMKDMQKIIYRDVASLDLLSLILLLIPLIILVSIWIMNNNGYSVAGENSR